MNETLKFIVALIAFLALAAGLELAAHYALYYVLEPENQQQLAAMLAPRLELLAELGVLRLALLGIAFAGLAAVAFGAFAREKIGGQTGDILGATQVLAEAAFVVGLLIGR